jgi:hypothetical protein
MHQALQYNQIYNFVLNHNHKFRNIIIIKTFKLEINNIIVDGPTIFNTSAIKINTCGPFYEIYYSPQ